MRFQFSCRSIFRKCSGLTLLACVLGFLPSALHGQDAPPPDAKSNDNPPDDDKLQFFRECLGDHRLRDPAMPRREFVLEPMPLMQFANPVSRILDGFVFLWTDRGRPAAILKSYYNLPRGSWGRTIVSLDERPVTMSMGDDALWTPQTAGLAFVPLPDAPLPADQPRQRLIQMRELARRFKIIDRWGLENPTDYQLRLLTTPLYRYDVPDENVVDGALFGYVVTTSPEALVLLEARKTAEGLRWYYAVSRFTRFGVTVSLDEEEVADFPRLDAWPSTGTYFHHPVSMPEYPFKPAAPAE